MKFWRGRRPGGAKYGNERTVNPVSGKVRDSKRESNRETDLNLMQRGGLIRGLQCQVSIPIEVYQNEAVSYLLGLLELFDPFANLEEPKRQLTEAMNAVRRSRQQVCTYVADFVYIDLERGGVEVIEDAKGHSTRVFRLKKRLLEATEGREITEV